MGGLLSTLQRWWSYLFLPGPLGLNPLQLFPALSDLQTFLVICTMTVWTIIAVAVIDIDSIPFDITPAVTILSATLGFVLPMQLSAALDKNKSGIDNFNAFCGDVMALGWQFTSFVRDGKVTTEEQERLDKIFDLLKVLPLAAKWHFRGDFDLNKLEVADKRGKMQRFTSSKGGAKVMALRSRLGQKDGMADIELIFFKLVDYIKDFGVSEGKTSVPVIMTKWNNVYGAWGNMGNIASYKAPAIFTYVLNTALFLYIIMLPLTFVEQGYNAVWMVLIVGYFFLGLNMAGRAVANPYVENARGFQSVTESQKTMTNAIVQVERLSAPIRSIEFADISRKSGRLTNV